MLTILSKCIVFLINGNSICPTTYIVLYIVKLIDTIIWDYNLLFWKLIKYWKDFLMVNKSVSHFGQTYCKNLMKKGLIIQKLFVDRGRADTFHLHYTLCSTSKLQPDSVIDIALKFALTFCNRLLLLSCHLEMTPSRAVSSRTCHLIIVRWTLLWALNKHRPTIYATHQTTSISRTAPRTNRLQHMKAQSRGTIKPPQATAHNW